MLELRRMEGLGEEREEGEVEAFSSSANGEGR
jgi:hypothetical protein